MLTPAPGATTLAPSPSGPTRRTCPARGPARDGVTGTLDDRERDDVDGSRLRDQLLVGRGDVRAVPGRPGVGRRGVAGVLRRLPLDQPRAQRHRLGPGPAVEDEPARGASAAARAASASEARRRTTDGAGRPAPATGAPASRRDERRAAGRGTHRAGHARSAAPARRSPPTWSAASPCRRRRASATSRPSCSRSTARSSTATAPRSGMGKVSFTHLIGYAIVRAIADAVPAMRNTFVAGADGKPRLVKHDTVNMGLAVDVDKSDGSRTLVVPGRPRRRHARLRRLPRRLRGADPQGQGEQADRRGLPGRHHHADQPRHDRHRPERAPADARPGRHRRRRARSTTRPSSRAPTAPTSARSASARSSRSPARTTTASSRAPRAACS